MCVLLYPAEDFWLGSLTECGVRTVFISKKADFSVSLKVSFEKSIADSMKKIRKNL